MRAVCTTVSWLLIGLLLLTAGSAAGERPEASGAEPGVAVHLFLQEGCPHCARARVALQELAQEKDVVLHEADIAASTRNVARFRTVLELFEMERAGVPLVVIGRRAVLGFSESGDTAALYGRMIEDCRQAPCIDIAGELARLSDIAMDRGEQAVAMAEQPVPGVLSAPDIVKLPLVGDVALSSLSLPLLAIVLGGIDGFNPCAMWVLVLLIGLLMGVEDRRRVWALGGAFLAVTAVVYYAILAAWLNVVLWIGAAAWLRIGIGAVSVGAGLHYLRDYWTNPEGVCRVTAPGQRRWLGDAFRRIVEEPSLALAVLGVAALAVAVNLVELLCSAGVPAVFTQVLTMHELSAGAYHAYLALYLAVFLLDDIAILVAAMIAARAAVASGRYARLSHLVGGAILLCLGAVMILRPEWLG